MKSQKSQEGDYISHIQLENLPIKLNIQTIQDSNNILKYYFDDSDEEDEDYTQLDVSFTIELIVDEQKIYPPHQTLFTQKQIFDQNVILNFKYKDLSYNSLLAITIWSAHKKKDKKKPLGSTTISLFDDQFRLRQGKHHLYIWPLQIPDTSYKSNTPGIICEENFKLFKESLENVNELKQKSSRNRENNFDGFFENTENIQINNYYIFQKIPAAFLEVVFPAFNTEVLFKDPQYVQENESIMQFLQNFKIQKVANIEDNSFQNCIVAYDFDFQNKKEDLIKEQLSLILREDDNPQELMPSKQDLIVIENSIKYPILCELKQDEKLLFYRYRYYLLNNCDALIKFLHSINWNSEKEELESIKLLNLWSHCNFEDALHLLSSSFCANEIYNKRQKKPNKSVLCIRKYACERLKICSDCKISSFLLQLTQALRYEIYEYSKSDLAQFLVQKSSQNLEIATQFYWYLHVEADNETEKSIQYNEKVTEWYKQIFQTMLTTIKEENKQIYQILMNQQQLRKQLKEIATSIKGKERSIQIEYIKKKLQEDEFKQPKFNKHPFCLNPKYILLESIPQKTNVFKSAMAPIKLTFSSLNDQNDSQKSEIETIYKSGDDLRQDQLVMQIFNLMDDLLKGVKQDFKLTPYKVLACSKTDGFIEYVPNSITIQDILQRDFSLSSYFRKLVQNPESKLYEEYQGNKNYSKQDLELLIKQQLNDGLKNSQLMENYKLSCAGYSVITYFLGVGDRHLENLMIDYTGKFFHIDFGFILGQDPKPYPPPIKLCKQMVEGMGGIQSEQYQEFKKKCVNAYIYLRKYAKLIVNLFYLMIDSGIKDMSLQALEKLVQKFNLDSSDFDAELHFLNILDESVNALFPIFFDLVHKWQGYWIN